MTKPMTSYDYAYIRDVIERGGEWLTGGEDVEVVTARWIKTGLPVGTIECYIDARTFEPEAARRMYDAGVTPFMAAQHVLVAGIMDTRGYWVSNGDM